MVKRMSDKKLAEIKENVDLGVYFDDQIAALIAEVDRLRIGWERDE